MIQLEKSLHLHDDIFNINSKLLSSSMPIKHWWSRDMALLYVFLKSTGKLRPLLDNMENSIFKIQIFLLKPWLMFFSMMAIDINYVRVFIIQIYLQPKRDTGYNLKLEKLICISIFSTCRRIYTKQQRRNIVCHIKNSM